MSDESPQDWDALAQSLLAVADPDLPTWIAAHRAALRIELIQALKRYGDAQQALQDPRRGDLATRYALHLAEAMPTEPLALALARWARGNWAMFHAPHEGITLYQQALAAYLAVDDRLSAARLQANLIAVLTDCGRFAEAGQAYEAAYPECFARVETEPIYLLRLEQNYGWLLHNQGRYTEALAVYARAGKLAQKQNFPAIAAEMEVNYAWACCLLGRLPEAEAAFLRARVVAEEQQQTVTVARVKMNLGILYTALGQPATALRYFQIARQDFTELHNHMEVGSVAMYEGALLQRIGAWRAARTRYQQAQAEFTSQQMWPQVAQALVYAATLARLSGDFATCATLLTEAEQRWTLLTQRLWLTLIHFERIALALAQSDGAAALTLIDQPLPVTDNPLLLAQRDFWLAETLRLFGETAAQRQQAHQAYTQVLQAAHAQADRWLERQALAGLGQLLLATDVAAGCQRLQTAIVLDEQVRQALSIEELKAGFQEQSSDLLPILIRTAVAQGQTVQALTYTWRAKGSAYLDLLQAVDDNRQQTEADTQLATLRQQLAAQRWRLATQSTVHEPDYLRERQDVTLQHLEQQLFEARQRRNRATTLTDPARLDQPAQWLRQMEADLLLEYIVCGDELLGIVADRTGACHTHWLTSTDTVADLLDELKLHLHNFVTQSPANRQMYSQQWSDEIRLLLGHCYDLLVAPLLALVDRSAMITHLLLAPCHPLALFPFAAFWDGHTYLVERFLLELIPSGALLTLASTPPVTPGPPVVIAASAEGMLTAAATEAAAIQSALPESRLLIDQPDTLATLDALTQSPRFLHLAAHSLLRTDAPIFSALQLTGEMLSVEHCYELKLSGAELVTLSACSTAAGQESGGALLAFQAAFLVAGAQRVLTTLWPVQDQATVAWMSRFYQALADGLPLPLALRETQLALLNRAAAHPADWAAFVCTRR